MRQYDLSKLWKIYRGAKSRQGLVCTLILALDSQTFTEAQRAAVQKQVINLWGVSPNEATSRVQDAVAQVDTWGTTLAVTRIANRFKNSVQRNKERLLWLFLKPYMTLPFKAIPSTVQIRFLAFGQQLKVKAVAEQMLRQALRSQRRAQGLPIEAGDTYEDGMLLYEDGEHELAIATITAALQREPEHVDALRLRCTIYLELERPDLARADAQSVLRLVPYDPSANYTIARLAARNKDVDTLLKHLYRALRGDKLCFMDHVLSDTDFDDVRTHPQVYQLLVALDILPQVIEAEVLVPYAVCNHCYVRGSIYHSRIRYKSVAMDFYRCGQCGVSHPSAVFDQDVVVWHTRSCLKCKRRGIYYLGSWGNPSITGRGDVCHFYKCAHPDCRHSWHKYV